MSSQSPQPSEEHLEPLDRTEMNEEHDMPSVYDKDNGAQHEQQATSESNPQPPDLAEPVASDTNVYAGNFENEFADVKEEDSDSEFLWAKMQEHTIDLAFDSDSDNESFVEVKKEPRSFASRLVPVTFNNEGNRVVELLDSDDEGFVLPIKKEPARFDWTCIPSEPIVLSDVEEDAVIKEEPHDVEFLWAEMGELPGCINLLSDEEGTNQGQTQPRSASALGHSLLQRSNPRDRQQRILDPDRFRQMQQMIAARAMEGRQGQRSSAGVGGILSNCDDSGHDQGDSARDNSNAWMHIVPQDNDATSNFAEIKRQYKAKKKAKTDTIQDDIRFKKAQDAERARIRRLEARMNQMNSSDEDEAEQSEDDLFIPDGMPPFKRRNPGDDGGNGEGDGEEGHRSKRQKPNEKPVRTKAELRNELYHNLMAGYEEEAAKDQKKAEHAAMQADRVAEREDLKKKQKKNPNAKHTHQLMKGKKPGGRSKTKPNTKSKRRPVTVRNLKTTNIYKESNANLAKLSMPAMTAKDKKKAMTNLIASIPLEQSQMRQATSDKVNILKATKLLGNCRVNNNHPEGVGDWNLKGITTPLFHHQVLGAARMKERECGDALPQGGILADEMGHGKTLSAIAAMISNPPAPSEAQRSTLIICSPALLGQWDAEIETHTKPGVFGGIIRHHGDTRVSSKGASGRDAIRLMEESGVVLSTYSQLLSSYPKCNIPEHLIEPVEKMAWWKDLWERERGILHRVQFYRVILDESQIIKNHRSSTSIACRALMAKHRWAISGTPIQNSIDEIYPYFKFLRIPHTGSFRIFKHNFCDPENEACTKRLHSYLDGMMIRRTHQDEILGTAILKLPKAHQETKYLVFNEIEGKIYSKIRKRYLNLVNIALADPQRSDEDRKRIILTMVLRLRQITSHIFLLHEVMEELFEVDDIDKYSEDLTENTPGCLDMLKALRMMLEAKDDEYNKDKTADKTKKGKDEPEMIFNFRKFLRTLKDNHKWAELRDRSNCQRCKEPPQEEPMLTSCSHIYCAECLRAICFEASERDENHAKCIKCNKAFTESVSCGRLRELDPLNIESPYQKLKKPQGLLSEVLPERPRRSIADTMKWVVMEENEVVHSTKTAAVTEQLEQWLKEFPSQKIIIFSQFHLVFQILGKVCEKRKWKYCHYNGKMSHKAREEAVENFKNDKEMKIMIASLKCGGIGLNLTMASRVICIDLWFNSSVEQQAFCRVLRIGQKQETHIARFVVRRTIDERLLELQKYKDKIIGAAMDDRSVLSKLSIKELLSLFGEVGHDANSQPFIYADEQNTEKCWGPMKEPKIVEAEEDEPEEEEAEEAD